MFGRFAPLLTSTKDGLTYDFRSPEVMYQVCPTLGEVYAYAQTTHNAEQAKAIRYPEGRPVTSDAVCQEYGSFLVYEITHAPIPLVISDVSSDMPYHYSGQKRAAYLEAWESYHGEEEVLHLYHVFSKQETMIGKYKAPRAITAHSKQLNLQVWPMIHAFERSLLSI